MKAAVISFCHSGAQRSGEPGIHNGFRARAFGASRNDKKNGAEQVGGDHTRIGIST
jgi:hypothetical protein